MRKRKIFNIFSFWEKTIFLILGIANISLLLFYYKGTDTYFSHQGIKAFKQKQGESAEKFFNQALKKKPFDPWTYLNLGLNYDFLLKQPDKAIEKYKDVSSHLNKYSDKALFYSYFNQAELFARTGFLEKALENYQKALEFQYKEKEIKKNIELLFQKKEEKDNKKENSQKKGNEKENQESKAQQEQGQKQSSENQKEQGQKQDSENQQGEKKEQDSENQNEEKKEQDSESQKEEREEQAPENQQENYREQDFRSKNSKEDFNNEEERAILKEIEENDAKTRKKFYQRKETFGDKTQKDW